MEEKVNEQLDPQVSADAEVTPPTPPPSENPPVVKLSLEEVAKMIQDSPEEEVQVSSELFRDLVNAGLVNTDGIVKFLHTGKRLKIA